MKEEVKMKKRNIILVGLLGILLYKTCNKESSNENNVQSSSSVDSPIKHKPTKRYYSDTSLDNRLNNNNEDTGFDNWWSDEQLQDRYQTCVNRMLNYHEKTDVPLDQTLLDDYCWFDIANNPDGTGELKESGCTRDIEQYLRELRELYSTEEIPIKATLIRRECRNALSNNLGFEEEAITFARDLFNQNQHCGYATFTDNDLVNSDGATYIISSYDSRNDNGFSGDEFLQIIRLNKDGSGNFIMIDGEGLIVQLFESEESERQSLSLIEGVSLYMSGEGSIADVVSVAAVNGLMQQTSQCNEE